MLSEFLLWCSALGLAFMGYILLQRDIIALVGVSVSQVAIGLGILTLLIAIWGRLADYRRWKCGFYIMAISLILLFLAEVLVVGYTQYIKWNDDTTFWDALDDYDQRVVMSEWECCDWDPVCPEDVAQGTNFYVYKDFRTSCKDATKDDYESWVMLVTIVFASAGGFHLIYTCIPCLGQAKRLDMKERRQQAKNKKQLEKIAEGGRLSRLWGGNNKRQKQVQVEVGAQQGGQQGSKPPESPYGNPL